MRNNLKHATKLVLRYLNMLRYFNNRERIHTSNVYITPEQYYNNLKKASYDGKVINLLNLRKDSI